MFTGHLPEWPFDWPSSGHARLASRVHPDFVALIRRSIELKSAEALCERDSDAGRVSSFEITGAQAKGKTALDASQVNNGAPLEECPMAAVPAPVRHAVADQVHLRGVWRPRLRADEFLSLVWQGSLDL